MIREGQLMWMYIYLNTSKSKNGEKYFPFQNILKNLKYILLHIFSLFFLFALKKSGTNEIVDVF